MKRKTLILIRHAHRDLSLGRTLDNGLSKKGLEQREHFTSYFLKHHKFKKTIVASSPSLRCVETVALICDRLRVPCRTSMDLYEEQPREGAKAFVRRVRNTLELWKTGNDSLTVLCSHGDWMAVALRYLCGKKFSLKKGAWIEIEMKENGILVLQQGSSERTFSNSPTSGSSDWEV